MAAMPGESFSAKIASLLKLLRKLDRTPRCWDRPGFFLATLATLPVYIECSRHFCFRPTCSFNTRNC
ncbi:MAG: hypothetical protein E5Y52_13475 [Mesorhizobium sp.]|nr:MAG: hypothetical protein E5Y52_13475 [Mesorhizobium sp.]